MVRDNDKKLSSVMTVSHLKTILQTIAANTRDDYEIWLSSYEEGIYFNPMNKDINVSVCIDKGSKAIIFLPSH